MEGHSTKLVKAALAAAHYVGADGWLAPWTRGRGVIFMLHHVRPEPAGAFEPNRILKVTPRFLEDVIVQVQEAGFDFIGLDEVPGRLAASGDAPPFACFTLDDGYRDNRIYAYPVFQRHKVPFTIYVPSEFPDGKGELWWLVLETAIARAPHVSVQMTGEMRHFVTNTPAEKAAAYNTIYWWLRKLPEDRARYVVAELADSIRYDWSGLCSELVMTWDELRALAADPLVTIGAHTKRHLALAKLPASVAEDEIAGSVKRIEAEMGRPCRHFSYPYGCANSAGPREFALAERLGLVTAVTTRKGLLSRHHAHALTALPRFSLNGDYQDLRYTKVMLSGAPFALWNAVSRG